MLVEKSLKAFGKRVQQQARANLTRNGNKASGNLYEKTKYDLNVSPNSFSLSFELTDYWQYQDQGVSGINKKYNTPFSYKSKRPPAFVFEKWAKQKGITPRDKKSGKFITFKAFGFAVANHIYSKGIKPTKFFSKPFENEFKKLPDEVVEAYSLDIEQFLTFTTS